MSRANAQMPSARRRPIPGMTSPPPAAPTRAPETPPQHPGEAGLGPDELAPPARSEEPSGGSSAPGEASAVKAPEVPAPAPRRRPAAPSSTSTAVVARRRPSRDYASTRLVNFRIPVDLHDRYKRLVREVEQTHQRLRHPSLTEVLIGLLEEGPDTADEVAAGLRRKRASEHGQEDHA
jgi:hypothetical protein